MNISVYYVFNGNNKTISADLSLSKPFNLTKSPWNFNIQYQGQQINVTDNFLVSNSVSAPATAMATNTNSDNDSITNSAVNAGGRKRKKRKAPIIDSYPRYNSLLSLPFIKPTKVKKRDNSLVQKL